MHHGIKVSLAPYTCKFYCLFPKLNEALVYSFTNDLMQLFWILLTAHSIQTIVKTAFIQRECKCISKINVWLD